MEEIMKKIELLTVAMLTLGLGAFGQTGREIMQMMEDQNTATTTQGRMEMRLIDAGGDVSTRVIDQFMQSENDLTKAMVIFQSPANVKNTRFLTVENAGRDDDRWIYLPNLRKTRRIAGSEGGESFMGSEFSYDDLSSRDLDDSTYTILGEERVAGEQTWKIQATPTDSSDSQYSKVITWVSQDKKVALKMEMYDKSGALEKNPGSLQRHQCTRYLDSHHSQGYQRTDRERHRAGDQKAGLRQGDPQHIHHPVPGNRPALGEQCETGTDNIPRSGGIARRGSGRGIRI
jgi:outer membrane lipoprotein-sorting protein